ncbi:MAG: hypothetical protein NVS9B10_19960 [Nevskia sp.]
MAKTRASTATAAPAMSARAQALFEAQVKYIVDDLAGAGLKALIEEEVDAALVSATQLKLGEAVTRQMIKDTARVFAVELEPGPGVPELVGEIARKLYAHKIHDRTRPGDLLADPQVAELLDKGLELESLREKLIREVVTSPLYAGFASDLLYRGITGYLAQNAVTRNIPGASSVMKLGRAALSKAKPDLEASLEESLKKYIARSVQASTERSAEFLIEHADNDLLREIGLDLWQKLKALPIGALRQDIGGDDIEEIFVEVYEIWRSVRRTDYYRLLIEAGIDGFFDKYEDETLATLLDDLGVTRELMIAEGLRYGPAIVRKLHKKKLLEPVVRRRLQGFYASPALAALLGA